MGGLPKDWYTICSFSPWAAQKSKFSKLFFKSPTMTIQDILSMFHAVCICFSPYLGIVKGPNGIGIQPANALFPTYTAEKSKFPKFMFLIL